jgi:hypothetical protein
MLVTLAGSFGIPAINCPARVATFLAFTLFAIA